MNKKAALAVFVVAALPAMATAQQSSQGFGPVSGEREFSIAGTGSSERNFDNGSFGVTGDIGWYLRESLVLGVRQSVNYVSIEGADLDDDFWNGATRGYLDYQFGGSRARPFLGGSLGMIYGDGVNDSGFAGLELGIKYYVLPKTYILARMEYQWFFDDGDIDDTFDNGAWAHTVGLGYNF